LGLEIGLSLSVSGAALAFKINALALEPGQNQVMGWVGLTEKYNPGWYWLLLHWEVGQDQPWHLVSDQSGTPIYGKYMVGACG